MAWALKGKAANDREAGGWGGVTEINSWLEHANFLNMYELLGAEHLPHRQCRQQFPAGSSRLGAICKLRWQNPWSDWLGNRDSGEQPWKVEILGIIGSSKAWGCGGDMASRYYADEFNASSRLLRDATGETRADLSGIASGAEQCGL